MELPDDLRNAHLLMDYNDLTGVYKAEHVDKLFADMGYAVVTFHDSPVYSFHPKTRQAFFLPNCWVKNVCGSWGYPRYHILPAGVKVSLVGDRTIVAVWLKGHIDREKHCTDASREASEKVERALAEIRQRSHEEFFGR